MQRTDLWQLTPHEARPLLRTALALRIRSRRLIVRRGVGVVLLADLQHPLAHEPPVSSKQRNGPEVLALPARHSPVQHARPCAADVLEAVHGVARQENQTAGPDGRRLPIDRDLIRPLDDEKHLILTEVHVVWWTFA